MLVAVRQSKTNPDGDTADLRYLKTGAARAVRTLRAHVTPAGAAGPASTARVVPLTGQQIGQRFPQSDSFVSYHLPYEKLAVSPGFTPRPSLSAGDRRRYAVGRGVSRTYNELFLRGKYQNGLNVLLDGPGGSRMTWGLGDPVASDGWGASQIAMITTLLPHIRQFVRVRQALVRAQAGDTTVTALLDNPRIGVLHLDRRGRILAVNDRARRASSDRVRGYRMRRGCCRPARRTTRAVWRGWWPRRSRPPARCRSVDRCCWAARPGCPRW